MAADCPCFKTHRKGACISQSLLRVATLSWCFFFFTFLFYFVMFFYFFFLLWHKLACHDPKAGGSSNSWHHHPSHSGLRDKAQLKPLCLAGWLGTMATETNPKETCAEDGCTEPRPQSGTEMWRTEVQDNSCSHDELLPVSWSGTICHQWALPVSLGWLLLTSCSISGDNELP